MFQVCWCVMGKVYFMIPILNVQEQVVPEHSSVMFYVCLPSNWCQEDKKEYTSLRVRNFYHWFGDDVGKVWVEKYTLSPEYYNVAVAGNFKTYCCNVPGQRACHAVIFLRACHIIILVMHLLAPLLLWVVWETEPGLAFEI